MKSNRLSIFNFTVILVILIALTTCSPKHPTPQIALTEFPGYLSKENSSSLTILQQEEIADGLVLFYRYQPNLEKNRYCWVQTFVSQGKLSGWQAQSGSQLICTAAVQQEFLATFTIGGNITDLSTAYGMGTTGVAVRIYWSDGIISDTPLIDNVFLKSRPVVLPVKKIDFIAADGTVLASKHWTE